MASRSRNLTIALAGDIHFEGNLAAAAASRSSALTSMPRTIAEADLAIANLETAIGEGGTAATGKRFHFQAPTSALTALAETGFDVLSMANNRSLDYGFSAGLMNTLRSAHRDRPGVATIGIGANRAQALMPAWKTLKGARVAVIAASVADQDPTADPTRLWAAGPKSPGIAMALNPQPLIDTVREASSTANIVLVYLHWGVQGDSCPSAQQKQLAARLVAAGADIVTGSHAHLLQGDVPMADAYVAYGLGNFMWYSQSTTAVLALAVRPGTPGGRPARVVSATWVPSIIRASGIPTLLRDPTELNGFAKRISNLRACAVDRE